MKKQKKKGHKKKFSGNQPEHINRFQKWDKNFVNRLILKELGESVKEDKSLNTFFGNFTPKVDNVHTWRPMNRMSSVCRKPFQKNPFEGMSEEFSPKRSPGKGYEGSSTNLADLEGGGEFFKEIESDFVKRELRMFKKYCDVQEIYPNNDLCRCFNSVLSLISEKYMQYVKFGDFLWELIYPKQKNRKDLPTETKFGKYVVKLFSGMEWRMVVVDNSMPYSNEKKLMFSQTARREHWPAILMKALFALAGEGNENMVINDPVFLIQSLCGNYISYSFPISNIVSMDTYFAQKLEELKVIEDRNEVFLSKILGVNMTKENLKIRESSQKKDHKKDHKKERKISTSRGKKQKDKNVISYSNIHRERGREIFVFLTTKKFPKQVYCCMNVRKLKEKVLLQLFGIKSELDLEYSYNKPVWEANFEQEIKFSKQNRIVTENCEDFWITREELVDKFEKVHEMVNLEEFVEKYPVTLGENVENDKIEVWVHPKDNTELYIAFLNCINWKKEVKDGTKKIDEKVEEKEEVFEIKIRIDVFDWTKFLLPQKIKEYVITEKPVEYAVYPFYVEPQDEKSKVERKNELYRILLEGKSVRDQVVNIISQNEIEISVDKNEIFQKILNCVAEKEEKTIQSQQDEESFSWKIFFMKDISFNNLKSSPKEGESLISCFVDLTTTEKNEKMETMIMSNHDNSVICKGIDNVQPTDLPFNKEGFTLLCFCNDFDMEKEKVNKYQLYMMYKKGLFSFKDFNPLYNFSLGGDFVVNEENRLFEYYIYNNEKTIMNFKIMMDLKISKCTVSVDLLKNGKESMFQRVIECEKRKSEVIVPLTILLQNKEKSKDKVFYVLKGVVNQEFSDECNVIQKENAKENIGKFLEKIDVEKAEEWIKSYKVEENVPTTGKKKKPKKVKKKNVKETEEKKVVKYPIKQDAPSFMKSVDFFGDMSNSVDILPERKEEFLSYKLEMIFSSPNVILEGNVEREKKIKIHCVRSEEESLVERNKKGMEERIKFYLEKKNPKVEVENVEKEWNELQQIADNNVEDIDFVKWEIDLKKNVDHFNEKFEISKKIMSEGFKEEVVEKKKTKGHK